MTTSAEKVEGGFGADLDLFEHPDFAQTLDMIPEVEAHRMLDHVKAIARRLRSGPRCGAGC